MGYLIFVGLVFIISIVIHKRFEDDWESIILASIITTMITGFVGGFILHIILNSVFEKEEYIESTTKIVAFKDNMTTNGTFFLGSGSVDDEMRYFYMVENEKGLQVKDIAADSAYLIEEDREDGSIEQYYYRFKNESVESWFPNLSNGYKVIRIPEGTVLRDFKVDLE